MELLLTFMLTPALMARTSSMLPCATLPLTRVQHQARGAFCMVAQEHPDRWEGNSIRRPLGQMERLLNARRSWSGAMTTAHVSAAVLTGPPLTETELLDGLEWVLHRHPMLSACVRGKSKYHIANAQPYPMHSDYLGRAVAYTKELLRTYPDDDIQRFEPSPLSARDLARRALKMVSLPASSSRDSLDAAWRAGFDEAMDELTLDEDADGPLWQLTLYSVESDDLGNTPDRCALVYAANHAVSDQRSFNLVLSELLAAIGEAREGRTVKQPGKLPLPPSVEGALLGKEQRQAEEIKSRLELIIGAFGEPWGPSLGGRRWIPSWKPGRVRLSSIKYALWQLSASGAAVLPRWVPAPSEIAKDEARWKTQVRTTRNVLRTLSPRVTSALVRACRARGVTASAALCAAAVLGAREVMGSENAADESTANVEATEEKQKYKLLLALDMRTLAFCEGESDRDGARDDWSSGTVLAGTGSLDILLDLPTGTLREADADPVWACAQECHTQTRAWIESGWGRESLLLFASGWEFMNMNRVVELGSQDRATLGRAYSAGVSNVGVYAHPTRHGGELTLDHVYFGISQTVSAPAISLSAVTVEGTLCLTVQYATPIWSEEQAGAFADRLLGTLEGIAASSLSAAPSD